MKFIQFESREDASLYVAAELFKVVHFNEHPLLGLATGGTMKEVYERLVALLKLNRTDVSQLETFNLDEYFMIDRDDPHSYVAYMKQHLFTPIGLPEEQFHLPDNDDKDIDEDNHAYDQAIQEKGPLHIQLLGIGENGHIGFNEPGTSFSSGTRLVELTKTTIEANARFFEHAEEVPSKAVSMGIKTILQAERIILLALGEKKADIIGRLYEMTSPDEAVPASSLMMHPHVEIVMDKQAAQKIRQM